MEKVRGRIRRMRHRFELPSCLKPKKDMPNLIYTVLDRECDRALVCHGRHHHHHHYHHHHILRRPSSSSSCKDSDIFNGSSNHLRSDGKIVSEDFIVDDVGFWDKEDGSCCEKEGMDCWNVNLLAEREGPTIRVATFDVALFSLAPAVPQDHPCAAAASGPSTTVNAAAPAPRFESMTPTHLLSSESSSIFSYKSKSTSSDASSGMTSFSNSRESTDSSETCAILSQHCSKPTQSFNVGYPQYSPKPSPVFDISKVWRSSSPSRAKARPSGVSSKTRALSPFKPIAKGNGYGNIYHSKLNPVFGLSSSSTSGSSRCLMDSLPSLFNDVLSFTDKGLVPGGMDGYIALPRPFDEKPMCSPSTLSQMEFSPCNSGFHTPLHPELFLTSPGAASPNSSSTVCLSNPGSPHNNSVCLFDSPCSALSSMAPSTIFNGLVDAPQPRSSRSTVAASILDILLEVDADIISLQEVRAEEERGMKPLSELAEALGMEYAYAESWAPEFGNAVLSRWPIKSASVQQIHDETDYRNVLKVVVEVPLAGDLNVYCTQLDHLDEDWRMKQVESFLRTVPASQPHILTGNFNSLERSDYSRERWEEISQARKQNRKLSPRGDVLKKLVQDKAYKDAKLAMGEGLIDAGLQLKGQGVDGTCQHGTRVDYILGSAKLPFDFVPGSYSVISSRGTSNHDLALVDLQPHCFM